MPGVTSPMVRVRRVTSARAAGDGLYCSWAIACSTRARVAGRTLGRSLMTRETVWCETPARRATSKMFAVRPRAPLAPARRRLTHRARPAGRPGRSASRRSAPRTARCRRSGRPARSRPGCATRRTSSSSAEMNITDSPLSASSPTRFCTSTLAPTSMPRVGSSSTSSAGRQREQPGQQHLLLVAARQRAGRAVEVRRAGCRARRPSSARARAAGPAGCRRRIPRSACSASVMFSCTLSSLMMPSVRRFSEE